MYDESLDGNMDESNHMVYVMKRSGERVPFDLDKIIKAIQKANNEEGIVSERLTEGEIAGMAYGIMKDAENTGRDLSV